jgi:hypothetical protein
MKHRITLLSLSTAAAIFCLKRVARAAKIVSRREERKVWLKMNEIQLG